MSEQLQQFNKTRNSHNLSILTDELRHNTQSAFGERLRKIIMYGSYARGDFNEYSDLDIMVLAGYDKDDESQLESQINRIANKASLDHDITVCMLLNNERLFMSRLSISPFYRNVIAEGVEL